MAQMVKLVLQPHNEDMFDVYRDEGSHSCGESRSDWVRIGQIHKNSVKDAIKQIRKRKQK